MELGDSRLMQLTREKGKETKRQNPNNGAPLEVYVYAYSNQGGAYYLFTNQMDNRGWFEQLTFKLSGCEIAGEPAGTSTLSFTLAAGESKFVRLRALASPFKAGFSAATRFA